MSAPATPPVPRADCPAAASVTGVVPMAHVVDVDLSARFYALLGFTCESRFSGADGVTNWSAMAAGDVRVFLARASGPIDAAQQAVLFYMYCRDVAALRAHLIARGIADVGAPPGEGFVASTAAPAVFDVVTRFYMPHGELRIHDPDGYVILVGQLE